MEPEGSLTHSQEPSTRPYSELDQYSPFPHHTSWRSILILSDLRLDFPSGLFPSGFSARTLCTPFLSPYMLLSPPISFFLIWSPE